MGGALLSALDEDDSFTLRPMYPREKGTQNRLEMRLRTVLGAVGNRSTVSQSFTPKIVTILTELSRLLLSIRLDSKCDSQTDRRSIRWNCCEPCTLWGGRFVFASSVKCPQTLAISVSCHRSMTGLVQTVARGRSERVS